MAVDATRQTREDLFAQVQSWNQRYSVGTEVTSDLYPGTVYKTRTAAMPLFDRKPVIYLEGFKGYFDLGEVHPVGAEASAPTVAWPVASSVTVPDSTYSP